MPIYHAMPKFWTGLIWLSQLPDSLGVVITLAAIGAAVYVRYRRGA